MISPAPADSTDRGWLSKLRRGLTRTRVNIVGLFSGGVVDEAFLEELETALIGADVGVSVSAQLIDALRAQIRLRGLKTQDEVRLALRDELARRLAPAEGRFEVSRARPYVVMVCGVNGSGKTTSIGKLAKWFAQGSHSVLLAAGDTFRAAAREQLAVWGARNHIEVIAQSGGDPAAVVFDAVAAAKARGVDVLIADTAGRLPTQAHLMEELKRVKRAQDKAMPGAPHEVILIVDGTNGQNALTQVQAFDAAVGLTGLVVTKLDGTAKGGVLAAICAERRDRPLPILFIGVGEGIDDLQPFSASEFADALVGTGATQ
ncbi:MAG TPA: signal recognition particle-docking protein FtsY [Burkholderiaceae bacterium]|nr:signal recognition particle-docking protein FtsY [Burkholderiaceae bacterium]